ncbi:hypothetical protein ACL58G_29150 [Massilia sp. GER05]|uniref:hypothetical protein n=1 Tax=Massilia sp. GER05 TaxID=3394605 RepID=UPI003F840943
MKNLIQIFTIGFAVKAGNALANDSQQKEHVERQRTSETKTQKLQKSSTQTDDYAWDNFNHTGAIIWACRAVKTGEFVSPKRCANKEKIDSQWPGMTTPPNFVGEIAD